MTRVKECVLYRGFEYGDILDKMTALMDASEKSAVNASEMEEEFYECVNGLIEIAGSYCPRFSICTAAIWSVTPYRIILYSAW